MFRVFVSCWEINDNTTCITSPLSGALKQNHLRHLPNTCQRFAAADTVLPEALLCNRMTPLCGEQKRYRLLDMNNIHETEFNRVK